MRQKPTPPPLRQIKDGDFSGKPPRPNQHNTGDRMTAKGPKTKTEYIIIRETLWKALLTDFWTLLLFISLISIGVYLDSVAMEWVGAIIGFITISVMAVRGTKGQPRTKEQAIKYLQGLEKFDDQY